MTVSNIKNNTLANKNVYRPHILSSDNAADNKKICSFLFHEKKTPKLKKKKKMEQFLNYNFK